MLNKSNFEEKIIAINLKKWFDFLYYKTLANIQITINYQVNQ